MLSPSHLHFRTLSPEARQSALQRLAWRGFDPRTISEQTGIRRASRAKGCLMSANLVAEACDAPRMLRACI